MGFKVENNTVMRTNEKMVFKFKQSIFDTVKAWFLITNLLIVVNYPVLKHSLTQSNNKQSWWISDNYNVCLRYQSCMWYDFV